MQPHGSLNHLYGAFLLDFLWPINLIYLVLSPYLVYFRVLPCVCAHLLAKMDSSKEVYGYVASSAALPHTCVVEKIFLTSRIRNIWPFISFLARAQHFSWSSFWSICLQGTNAGCSIQCPSVFYLSPSMGREHRWISPVTMMKKEFTIGIFSFLIQLIYFLLTVLFLFNYISSHKSFELGSSSGRQFFYIFHVLEAGVLAVFCLKYPFLIFVWWTVLEDRDALSLCSEVQVCLLSRITLVHLDCHKNIP